jgi:hypothetical protein
MNANYRPVLYDKADRMVTLTLKLPGKMSGSVEGRAIDVSLYRE